jgi:hypothetical protein
MTMAPQIRQLAQDDTPSKVEVPEGWAGIMVWAVGRFGVGILMATACSWALMRVYDDLRAQQVQIQEMHRAQNESLMLLMREDVKAKVEMTVTLNELRAAISQVAADSRAANERNRP